LRKNKNDALKEKILFIINFGIPNEITFSMLYLTVIQLFKAYPGDRPTFLSTNFEVLLKRFWTRKRFL